MLVGEHDWGASDGIGGQVMGWDASHGWGGLCPPMGWGA